MEEDQYLKTSYEISKHQNRKNILKIFRGKKSLPKEYELYWYQSCHQQPLHVRRP